MNRLYKELTDYSKKDYYPFHMPGHKRNPYSIDGDFSFDRDITEIDGFDNLHHPEGILKEAQEAVSELYGSLESFYSINGSTAALLSAVSASVERGGKILMARNCHKAVYHAVYLRNLNPVYIYPQTAMEFGINGGILPEKVDNLLAENPEIEAVLITSPTYDGIVSDIKQIAKIAHSYKIPLIVDEAHGAHFRFSEYFPVSAVELGADIVIQSLHKTLPSMTQTAVLHRCSERVAGDLLRRFMGIYQSSSPSYILMASMDACMDKLSRDGEKMFREFTVRLDMVRKRLSKCKHIRLITPEKNESLGIYDFDRSKLLLSTENSTLTGHQFHKILREEFLLEMEMEAENYVLALTSAGDTEEGFIRLCEAVEEIDRRESLKIYKKSDKILFHLKNLCAEPEQRMSITDAMEAPAEVCPLEESIGKISAEFAYLYPPGIPILAPGEQITGLLIRNMRRYKKQGLELQGLKDYTNETICVVKE